jgi:hypothetical protein
MLTLDQHLDNLTRHIGFVRDACLFLGKKLIAQGRHEFGRKVIARGFTHDISKFQGIEWEYLHAGKDVPTPELGLAIKHHILTNDHHPESWGGFSEMPEICIAEMSCDCYARGQEFGTNFREWIEKDAVKKYRIDTNSTQYKWLMGFVDLLVEDHFKR